MKLGLVLEGGAAYCAFQAGAIDELHRRKIHPPQPLPLLFPFDFHGNRMERVFEIGQQAARNALRPGAFQ